ncbi:hypothetical protein D3C73_1394890 [compost metagenome]
MIVVPVQLLDELLHLLHRIHAGTTLLGVSRFMYDNGGTRQGSLRVVDRLGQVRRYSGKCANRKA